MSSLFSPSLPPSLPIFTDHDKVWPACHFFLILRTIYQTTTTRYGSLSHQLSIKTKHTRVHTHTHNRCNLTCHWELHNCNQLLALSERVIAPAVWSYLIKMSSSRYDYMAQSTQMKISSPYPCTIHQLLYSKQWSIRVKTHLILTNCIWWVSSTS